MTETDRDGPKSSQLYGLRQLILINELVNQARIKEKWTLTVSDEAGR